MNTQMIKLLNDHFIADLSITSEMEAVNVMENTPARIRSWISDNRLR